MNTDRFLTRVWDKQEKKMLYPTLSIKDAIEIDNAKYAKFLCIFHDKILFETSFGAHDYDLEQTPFGDRFIPMQCTGLRDKNKKLICDDDIINRNNENYVVKFGIGSDSDGWLCEEWLGYIGVDPVCLNDRCPDRWISLLDLHKELEIIGNIHEHPTLLEENKDDT